MRTFVMSSESRDIPLRNLYPNATGLFLSCAQNGGHARNKGGPAIAQPQPKTPREVGGRVRLGRTTRVAMSAPVRPPLKPGRLRKRCESCSLARINNWLEYSDENRLGLAERSRQIGKGVSPD